MKIRIIQEGKWYKAYVKKGFFSPWVFCASSPLDLADCKKEIDIKIAKEVKRVVEEYEYHGGHTKEELNGTN